MSDTATADWTVSDGTVTVCGTHMKEHHRRSEGIRWCFHCRVRHEFWYVVSVPDGFSYYGPSVGIKGIKPGCSDLFPGWTRTWEED